MMPRVRLVLASLLVASGLLAATLVPANRTTSIDPRLAPSSNSAHDMPSATQRLEARGVDASTTGLLSLADDDGADVALRYLAILALGEAEAQDTETQEIDAILLRALDARDADLRYAAIVALRDRGGRSAERAISRALDDPAEGVRSVAIASLAPVGGPFAARTLAGRLAMGLLDGYQAVDAAVTLGEIGQPIAAPALRRALADSLAADCPPDTPDAACLDLHLAAATERDEMPIIADCSANLASAADLRAAVGAALSRLGEPSVPALVLGALHPCTSDWLRTDTFDRLTQIDERPFVPTKRLAADGQPSADTLHDIATWWRQR